MHTCARILRFCGCTALYFAAHGALANRVSWRRLIHELMSQMDAVSTPVYGKRCWLFGLGPGGCLVFKGVGAEARARARTHYPSVPCSGSNVITARPAAACAARIWSHHASWRSSAGSYSGARGSGTCGPSA